MIHCRFKGPFDEIYGTAGSDQVKDRPFTFREKQNKLKPPLPSLCGKQRGFVPCVKCGKKRVIYSKKKILKKDQEIFQDLLDTIHFTCGDVLLPEDEKYKILADNLVSVDRRKNCNHPVETYYYQVPQNPTVCCECNTEVSADIKTLLEQRKQNEFDTVIPCCIDPNCIKKNLRFSCGPYEGWICKRPKLKNPRKQLRERKRKHDESEKRMKKKRKISPQ